MGAAGVIGHRRRAVNVVPGGRGAFDPVPLAAHMSGRGRTATGRSRFEQQDIMLGILAKAYVDLLGVATFTPRARREAGDRFGIRSQERGEPGARRWTASGTAIVRSGRSWGALLP